MNSEEGMEAESSSKTDCNLSNLLLEELAGNVSSDIKFSLSCESDFTPVAEGLEVELP